MAILALNFLLATAIARAAAPFDELLQRIQNDPIGTSVKQRTLVENSLKYVEEGANRLEVVDALASIASLKYFRYACDAVRALAYIGGTLERTQLREALLRVITGDETRPDARKVAGDYLALEADESIRTSLLDYVKTHSGGMIPTEAAMVLYHCGDMDFQQLLEDEFKNGNDWQNDENPNERSRKYRLEYLLHQMRLARRPMPEIVSAISSGDKAHGRQYLIQQAARQGVDPEPYRAAVVKFLSLPHELTKWAWKDPLIEDCHRLGLFTPEQAKKFPIPDRGHYSGDPSVDIVPWAKGYEEKWRQVHSFRKKPAAED